MKAGRFNRKDGIVAYGMDPVDRCSPPIAYEEHSITMDCGHGRNCGGVVIISSTLLKPSKEKCYNTNCKKTNNN